MADLDVVPRQVLGERFGQNLRRLRKAAGVSGEELALALGLEGQSARNAISRIERGHVLIDLHRAHLLAVALQVSLDDLVRPIVGEDQREVSPAQTGQPEQPPQPPQE